MKFTHGSRRRALEYEKDWVQRWKQDKTFEKSVENRSKDNAYVFYDGPPFISGVPHHGTLLSSIVKDAIPRYQTMKGKRVERVWGWDCHGLPAERFTEKKLGIHSRQEVIEYGIEKYINATRDNMVQTSSEWEDVVDRIGRWVDFKGAYKTMDKEYMESIWWAFKTLYEKGKIYEGEKVLMYCTLDGTPLSKAEVTMDAGSYQDVTDPSVYVKFALKTQYKQAKDVPFDFRVNKFGYIGMDYTNFIKSLELPETFSGLDIKKEFHLSLAKLPADLDDDLRSRIEEVSLRASELLKTNPPELSKEFRFAKDGKKETIIVRVEPNDALKLWRTELKKICPDLLFHFPHVTLYKNDAAELGIPIPTEEVYQTSTRAINSEESHLLSSKIKNIKKYLLAWTTTPWTLSANTALAVNKDVDYVEVEHDGESMIVAKDLVEKVFTDEKHQPLEYKITRELKGEELVGLSYEPLFEDRDKPTKNPTITITDSDFTNKPAQFYDAKSWLREAVRAVLENTDGKIALMHSEKYDYYKLPGGGIEDGESKKAALQREIMEEAGAQSEVLQPIGSVEELRAYNENQRQISYAFYAKVVGDVGENSLEEDELAEEFKVVWVDLDEAIQLTAGGNRDSKRGLGMRFMARREELLLRAYRDQLQEATSENAHKIWHADYVETEAGTGIVHIAPAYGEEDFALAQKMNIPVVHTLDQNGFFTEGDWKGENVWEINKQIAKDLKERGMVWKIDYIRHSYPHCHRCNTKLMYRAHPSWFMDIAGQRAKMLEKNEPINWFPAHVKNGRFAKTVETAPDWNISRDRFWATAMPVWKSESGKVRVVGSYAELKELSGVELDDYHRPWIDDVKFTIDGEQYTRIDKVMDSWFEAGSMPFAQFHYPFENKEKFEANFPGDFIVEYIGQVRAWFYYMHAMNVALFGENSFKNVIVTGNVAGNDGRKMSKSYGNFTDPNELMDKFSADSLRFLLLSSPLLNGEDFALQDKEVGDVARKLSMIWNMYDFFTMYAEVDNFTFPYDTASSDAFLLHSMSNTAQSGTPESLSRPGNEKLFEIEVDVKKLKNPLDKWIISRVHQLNAHLTKHMDDYNLPEAMSEILPFIEDASNWYVRRSRRRFWKSEDDGDKNDAYRTLHYVLLKLSVLVAPFTPFLAEELYQKLGGGADSVHLLDWPTNYSVDQQVLDDMKQVREYVNEGLSLRAKAGLKVRQPLASVTVQAEGKTFDFTPILLEELNVKEVKIGKEIAIDETLTPELRCEGLMREVIRHVQSARKKAGLQVDDRIVLQLDSDDAELTQAIQEHLAAILEETLAIEGDATQHQESVHIDGAELAIGLARV